MKQPRRRLTGLLGVALALILVVGLAGCVSFKGENPPQPTGQDTPVNAVNKFFNSMQDKNFDAYIQVSWPTWPNDPATGQKIEDADQQKLRDAWTTTDKANAQYWEAKFQDLAFEEIFNDGTNAVVEVNGGLIQYSGKELFGTSEVKVDNYKDKPGRLDLTKIRDNWYITGGGELNRSENWEVPPISTP